MSRPIAQGVADAPPGVEQLLGLDDAHVSPLDADCAVGVVYLHPSARVAFMALRAAGGEEGFDLRVVSGYRSFRRQAWIWNGKARGERPVLDALEKPLDMRPLTDPERVEAILLWSALPGCSRHHWGTDMDVVDLAALAPDTPVRLLASDWAGSGAFARLDRWLEDRIARGESMGLFRPYTGHGCAVAPEPWHLSYAPLAAHCESAFDPAALRATLREERIELLAAVEARLDDILDRYVKLPPTLYPDAAYHGSIA